MSDASSIEGNEDMEIAYPITCGESKAVLLWKKFVCPGINVKCVKVISPVLRSDFSAFPVSPSPDQLLLGNVRL
jgi:hypothetical protein